MHRQKLRDGFDARNAFGLLEHGLLLLGARPFADEQALRVAGQDEADDAEQARR